MSTQPFPPYVLVLADAISLIANFALAFFVLTSSVVDYIDSIDESKADETAAARMA